MYHALELLAQEDMPATAITRSPRQRGGESRTKYQAALAAAFFVSCACFGLLLERVRRFELPAGCVQLVAAHYHAFLQ